LCDIINLDKHTGAAINRIVDTSSDYISGDFAGNWIAEIIS